RSSSQEVVFPRTPAASWAKPRFAPDGGSVLEPANRIDVERRRKGIGPDRRTLRILLGDTALHRPAANPEAEALRHALGHSGRTDAAAVLRGGGAPGGPIFAGGA